MFADFANMSAQADHRRAELLADAENFRLARLVRRAGRRRRPDTAPSDPPQPGPASHNDRAERRYAVSR
jgi:hypothetical protein